MWRDRAEYPDLKRAIVAAYEGCRWPPRAVFIEDAASGQSVVQDLRRSTKLPVIPVRPEGSKENRADAIAPLFEAGKVVLPAHAAWLEDWIAEHIAFPAGAHDDQVDTTSLALGRLALLRHADAALSADRVPGGTRPAGGSRAATDQRP